jgi:hypothetical protein
MAFTDNYSPDALTELNDIKTLAGKQNTAVLSKYFNDVISSIDVVINEDDSDARTMRYSDRMNRTIRKRNALYKYLQKFEEGATVAQPFFSLFAGASSPEVVQTLKSISAPIDVINNKYLSLKYETNRYASILYGNTTSKTGDQQIKSDIQSFKNYFFP